MLNLHDIAGGIALGLTFASAAHAQSPAPTSLEPKLVGDGIISTARNETFPAIDPRDGSLWYSSYDQDFDRQVIMRAARSAARSGARWDTPTPVPFINEGEWGGRAPRFSPDGTRLYFTSGRPTAENFPARDMNLWMVERNAKGEWGTPVPLNGINGPTRDMHSSETKAGDLYFGSGRPGGLGRSDIWRAKRSAAGWSAPQHLPGPINDAQSQPDLFVSPDGTWMILVVTNHPQGLGGDDLFLSTIENGAWSIPRHLPAPINSPSYEYGPSLSPDGKTFYFTSGRRGNEDLYELPVSALGLPATRTNR